MDAASKENQAPAGCARATPPPPASPSVLLQPSEPWTSPRPSRRMDDDDSEASRERSRSRSRSRSRERSPAGRSGRVKVGGMAQQAMKQWGLDEDKVVRWAEAQRLPGVGIADVERYPRPSGDGDATSSRGSRPRRGVPRGYSEGESISRAVTVERRRTAETVARRYRREHPGDDLAAGLADLPGLAVPDIAAEDS